MNNFKSNLPEDEIDFSSIGRKIILSIKYPFSLLFANKLISLVFMLLAFATALIFKFTVTKSYSTSFIIRPNDRTEKFHVRMLEDVRSLLKHKDWQTLSQTLNMDSVKLRDIAEIKVYPSTNKVGRDSINYTEVQIESYDYHMFIPLQTALLNFLESNPYFNKIKTLELNKINQENPLIEKDILLLDSLKKLQIANFANHTNLSPTALLLGESADPVAYYNMSIARMNKKYTLMAQNAFLDNFQLVKSCVVVKKPSWPPRIIVVLCVTIPIYLFLCFIFLVIKSKLKA